DLADGADHEGLGEARHADEQAVAAGEDGGQDLLDDLALADDDASELGEHLGSFLAELGEDLAGALGGHRGAPGGRRTAWWYCTTPGQAGQTRPSGVYLR